MFDRNPMHDDYLLEDTERKALPDPSLSIQEKIPFVKVPDEDYSMIGKEIKESEENRDGYESTGSVPI